MNKVKVNEIEEDIIGWAADNKYSVVNKHNGNWVIFQTRDGKNGYFEYGFNGITKVSFSVEKDVAPQFYKETKDFVNRILKKYNMELIK